MVLLRSFSIFGVNFSNIYILFLSRYNRNLYWGFLERIILKLGFDISGVELIKLCVTTVRYSIRVNDQLVGPIIPTRGLRQGCPLSPYLFVICAQGLSSLIEKSEMRGLIHGCKICKKAHLVSPAFSSQMIAFFSFGLQEQKQII